MDIYKALDVIEKIGKEVSDLYRWLHEEFRHHKEASALFDGLHMKKEACLQLIQMERRIVRASPREFRDAQIDASEAHRLLENIANLKAQRPELPELIKRIHAIEHNAASNYLFDAMKAANDDLHDFLGSLSRSYNGQETEIEDFAQAQGIELTAGEERHLRSARVGFTDPVRINGQLGVRGVDISEGGMFLLTGRSVPAGAALSLQFSVMQRPIAAKAVVQFCIEQVGMGIRFTELADDDRQAIAAYVARRIEGNMLAQERRVLLVGSHRLRGPDMRVYINALVADGFKVVDISDFDDALVVLRKGLDLSCVILSLNSNEEANFSLIPYLQSKERYRHLPVLAVTGNHSDRYPDTLVQAGVYKVLARHATSPRRLLDEVKAALAAVSAGGRRDHARLPLLPAADGRQLPAL